MYRRNFVPTLKAFSLRAVCFAAAFFFVFGIFSCENFGGDVSSTLVFMPEAQAGQAVGAEEAAAIPQAEAVQAEQAALGVGRVTGNISQAAEGAFSPAGDSGSSSAAASTDCGAPFDQAASSDLGGVSKSVVPTAADVLGGVASYRVFAWGTKADGTVVPQTSPIMGTVIATAGGAHFSLELDYGTWSVRADALNGAGKVVLSQTQENVEISAASPLVSLNFKVTYYQDASVPGAFALPISFDTGAGITSVNYSLTSSNGTNISSASPYDLTSCGGSFTLDSSVNPAFASITPANCDLVLEFLDSSNALIIRLDQSVQIYSNITTNKIDGTAPYISASGGSAAISITNAVIKSYHDSSVYVGGVGAVSGTPASDANSGTQFDPVEHLSRALEILDASAAVLNPTDGFKIYLQGDAALTADLALNKSYKLSIIGTNSTAHSYYKIDGGQNYGITSSMSALACKYVAFDKIKGWVVSAGQAEFINCDITNGRIKTGTNGGAGLCVNGSGAKAVLKNCSISGCSTDEFGGGIYVQDDSSTATAQVELTDCVIGEEGGSCATASVYSNFAYLGGGGINVGDHGKAVLANTKIFYNSAGGNSTGGGIRCNGGTLEIDGGQINHNYAASGGGGIWSDGTVTINGCAVGELSAAAPATASDCGNYSNLTGGGGIELEGGTFESASGLSVIKNYSPKKGGGININGAASLTLSGAAISHNASASSGGGVCAASTTAHFSITGGAVNNNKANNGGGLSLETQSGASPTLSGVEVKGNEASGNGGGIQVTTGKYLTITGACDISGNDAANGGGISAAGKVTIESGTISGNTATAEGGGVYINSTTALFKFQGGTISGNTATGDGGGVYACGGGTMLMSGSAVIGDKNAASYATETAHSNKAQNGGGIAVDNASVYIGYTTTSSPQDAFEGGIYHNFAQAGGGGVYMGDESATKLYLYKGNVDKNCAITFGGGAICCGHAGELIINKTVISGNVAAWYGGGIAIGDENPSTAAITIEDALIQENSAVVAGSEEGGAIRAAGYASFELKGSVSIPAGVGGTTGPGKNDVWLATGKSITIGSSLSATATPVATITPAAYSPGTTVLVDDGTGTLVTSEISKFAVTPESEDDEWTIGINSSGGTPVGVLTKAVISVTGEITISLGGKISFAISVPTASNNKAAFVVKDSSSGSPVEVTPTSARIEILQYGTAIYSADAQEVTATYLAPGDYELYCKAVVGGVTYDTTLPFAEGFVVVEGTTVVGGDKFRDAHSEAGVFVAGRSVAISTFWICDHEVTQAEYQAVMGTNPSNFDGSAGDKATPSGETQEKRPVEMVSWYDALVYCNKKSLAEGLSPCYTISGKTDPAEWGTVPTSSDAIWDAATCDFTKSGYRLPTEAEWEYAARGGRAGCEADNPTDYAGTDSEAELGKYAWYISNSDLKTHEVKTSKVSGTDSANSLGIYDMSGNVWEWCWDWYDSIYASTPAAGASSGSHRVNRGGSFVNYAYNCFVADRHDILPYYRFGNFGFRVVRTAP